MYIHDNTDIDYISVQKTKSHNIPNKIVEGPVNKGTPRPAVMIIWEFIRVVSFPRKVCTVFLVSGSKQLIQCWLFCIILSNYESTSCNKQLKSQSLLVKQHLKNPRNRALICFFCEALT